MFAGLMESIEWFFHLVRNGKSIGWQKRPADESDLYSTTRTKMDSLQKTKSFSSQNLFW